MAIKFAKQTGSNIYILEDEEINAGYKLSWSLDNTALLTHIYYVYYMASAVFLHCLSSSTGTTVAAVLILNTGSGSSGLVDASNQ